MSFQNVKTPRFYIDLFNHLSSSGNQYNITSNGLFDAPYTKINLGVSTINTEINYSDMFPYGEITSPTMEINFQYSIPKDIINNLNYCGLLRHNIPDVNAYEFIDIGESEPTDKPIRHYISFNTESNVNTIYPSSYNEIINANIVDEFMMQPLHSGFSLYGFDKNNYDGDGVKQIMLVSTLNTDNSISRYESYYTLGSFTLGTYYDMPHAPDLQMTLDTVYDGVSTKETSGGSTFCNTSYSGVPDWDFMKINVKMSELGNWDGSVDFSTEYKTPAWTIFNDNIGISRTRLGRRGRRVWNLKFSYLSEKDLFSSNYYGTKMDKSSELTQFAAGYLDEGTNANAYTLDTDDSFHAQVLNKIANGQRFIFQPDKTNNNPDQFFECKLKDNSISINRVSKSMYNIAFSVEEVW